MSVNLYKLENELEAIKFLLSQDRVDWSNILDYIKEDYEESDIILIYLDNDDVITVEDINDIHFINRDNLLIINNDSSVNFVVVDNISYIKLIKRQGIF